jgi:8-oxo-dGTP diphosphatase
VNTGLASGRKVTEVAVGVLLRPDGAVLLADRPAGKPYAGYWEFPGGKIEPGESVEHALARELHEELGIDIGPATPWITFEFDYPHAYVRLHFCRVSDWRGAPHGREGQRTIFHRRDAPAPTPLLPAAVPALRWLGLPAIAAEVDVEAAPAATLLAQIDAALASGTRLLLLRRRGCAAPRPSFQRSVHEIVRRAAAHLALVVVEGELAGLDAAAVCGVLLDGHALGQATVRPAADWVGAAVADRSQLELAARLGCDFALAGPVLPAPAGGKPALLWHGVAEFARRAPLPVFACGGLAAADLARAQHAGAHGVAVPLVECLGGALRAR